MAAIRTSAMPRLAQLMQSLPQELYDKIYDLTFNAVRSINVTIDHAYIPPSTLQVDRTSRTMFARIYHGTSIFRTRRIEVLAKWLLSIPHGHRNLLQFMIHEKERQTVRHVIEDTGTVAVINNMLGRFSIYTALLEHDLDEEVARLVKIEFITEEEDGSVAKRSSSLEM